MSRYQDAQDRAYQERATIIDEWTDNTEDYMASELRYFRKLNTELLNEYTPQDTSKWSLDDCITAEIDTLMEEADTDVDLAELFAEGLYEGECKYFDNDDDAQYDYDKKVFKLERWRY